jgi:hypothetical protein
VVWRRERIEKQRRRGAGKRRRRNRVKGSLTGQFYETKERMGRLEKKFQNKRAFSK